MKISRVFAHYPYFIFAVLPNGKRELWIASCYTLDVDNPESFESKLVREDLQACRSYYRRTFGMSVTTEILSRDQVQIKEVA